MTVPINFPNVDANSFSAAGVNIGGQQVGALWTGQILIPNNGNTGKIESSDVFGYADGHTTSKYYGRHRAMDLTYSGAVGLGVAVWSVFDTRESSSGGPFYRDIENQADGAGSGAEPGAVEDGVQGH